MQLSLFRTSSSLVLAVALTGCGLDQFAVPPENGPPTNPSKMDPCPKNASPKTCWDFSQGYTTEELRKGGWVIGKDWAIEIDPPSLQLKCGQSSPCDKTQLEATTPTIKMPPESPTNSAHTSWFLRISQIVDTPQDLQYAKISQVGNSIPIQMVQKLSGNHEIPLKSDKPIQAVFSAVAGMAGMDRDFYGTWTIQRIEFVLQ